MDGLQTRMEEETTALTQLSALMQAAVEAPEGALQVLFPMIPDVDAWRTRMDQMKRCNEPERKRFAVLRESARWLLDRNPRRCVDGRGDH